MRIGFDGRIENKKLRLYDQEMFDREVDRLDGKTVRVFLERGNKRTSAQNRYWWGVVIPLLADAMSEDDLELVHEFIKQKFLPEKVIAVNPKTGEAEESTVGGSSAALTTIRFMEMIEKVQRWAAEFLGCVIPDPNQEEMQDAGQ